HLLSFENTRAEVFADLWDRAMRSPFLGEVATLPTATGVRVSVGESSYLSMAATLGIVGLLMYMAFVFATIASIRRVIRLRSSTRRLALTDLFAGGVIAILVGGLTEGYLLAVMSPVVTLLYAYTFLIDSYTRSLTH